MTERLGGKAGSFKTADDIERIIASVDPSRGLQLKDAIDIISKGAKSKTGAIAQSPFVKDAPVGQYAIFFGPSRDKLLHVIHGEVLPNRTVRMFDPQNGQAVSVDDLLSLRIKWGGQKDSPIIPIYIRGND